MIKTSTLRLYKNVTDIVPNLFLFKVEVLYNVEQSQQSDYKKKTFAKVKWHDRENGTFYCFFLS